MALEGIKFSIPEILKTIGNKDEVLDKDEIKLFTEKCREYERLSNQEKQSIFEIVRNAMSDENKILMKDTGNVEIPFEIVSNNEFDDSNIRISMYKKNKLSAYDQTYSLIDLMDYSTNEFDKVSDSIYIVEGNGIKLKLDLSSLDKTGYEIRFELYDGDKKIDTIKKKIIVR